MVQELKKNKSGSQWLVSCLVLQGRPQPTSPFFILPSPNENHLHSSHASALGKTYVLPPLLHAALQRAHYLDIMLPDATQSHTYSYFLQH